KASCLLFGLMDGSRPAFGMIIEAQKKAAETAGCAYWDARAFMGGEGSARAWESKGYLDTDKIHPSPKGAVVLGDGFADALEEGYAGHLGKTPTRQPPALSPASFRIRQTRERLMRAPPPGFSQLDHDAPFDAEDFTADVKQIARGDADIFCTWEGE